MKTQLNSEDIVNFWIRCYFGKIDDYINQAIDRAYLDFCRTLTSLPDDETLKEQYKKNWKNIIKERLAILLNSKFANCEEFDKWHQGTCTKLRIINDDDLSFEILLQGQAQKWLNMTLKYLYAFGEDNVKGISENYQYFHIPIDNIIQEKFLKKYNIPKFKVSWSRIKDYNSYFEYQTLIREKIGNQIPMDIEFILFNS